MIGYLFLFLLFFVFSSLKNKTLSLGLLFFVIFIFSAIRYKIGFDYEGYLELITRPFGYNAIRVGEIEPLSRFLIRLSQNGNTYLFFILSSFLTVFTYWYGIKKESSAPKLSLYIFITLPFFMMLNFSIIRNGMAFGFIFIAATVFKDSRIKQVLCIIIAYLFHQSGALGIIILIPWDKLTNVKILWLMFLSSFFIRIIIFEPLLEILPSYPIFSRFSAYISNYGNLGGGTLLKYMVYGINLLYLIKYKVFIQNNPKMKYYIAIICIGASFYALLESYSHVAMRFCVFFFSVILVTIADLKKVYRIPTLYIYTLCTLIFIFYIINMHFATIDKISGISPVFPYKTIFIL